MTDIDFRLQAFFAEVAPGKDFREELDPIVSRLVDPSDVIDDMIKAIEGGRLPSSLTHWDKLSPEALTLRWFGMIYDKHGWPAKYRDTIPAVIAQYVCDEFATYSEPEESFLLDLQETWRVASNQSFTPESDAVRARAMEVEI